jgi:hypothetical protein
MIFAQAETEVGFTVDIQRSPDGSLAGTIAVSELGLSPVPLKNVQAQGGRLSFELHDEKGVRVFTGTLANGVIRGQTARSSGSSIPFELSRPSKDGGRKKPTLEVLTNGSQLQSIFDHDRDRVRLILLLSPT